MAVLNDIANDDAKWIGRLLRDGEWQHKMKWYDIAKITRKWQWSFFVWLRYYECRNKMKLSILYDIVRRKALCVRERIILIPWLSKEMRYNCTFLLLVSWQPRQIKQGSEQLQLTGSSPILSKCLYMIRVFGLNQLIIRWNLYDFETIFFCILTVFVWPS